MVAIKRKNDTIKVEVAKSEKTLIAEIKFAFPEFDFFEVNSIDADSMVYVVIPLVAIIAPTVKDIVNKLCDCNKVTLKHDGKEISGNRQTVIELWNMLKEDVDGDAKTKD